MTQREKLIELIIRETLKRKLLHWQGKLAQTYGENDEYVRCLDDVIESYIENAHAVDAVPVVRCRDCKYHEDFCSSPDNWYCADGKRKDEVSE